VSRLATWAPPIVWTAVVLVMSSASFNAYNTGAVLQPLLTWLVPWLTAEHLRLLHGLVRKAAHLTEYAILAALWFRAFTRTATSPTTAAWLALAVSVACAVVDETHQALVPTRTGSAGDVMIDAVGALAALAAARLGWVGAAEATTSVLLWIAVAGGALMLALGVAAGAGGGALWLTVPLAAGLLIYRRRRTAPRG
jgi:VanZ family protein